MKEKEYMFKNNKLNESALNDVADKVKRYVDEVGEPESIEDYKNLIAKVLLESSVYSSFTLSGHSLEYDSKTGIDDLLYRINALGEHGKLGN